jgi:hypothetical protein
MFKNGPSMSVVGVIAEEDGSWRQTGNPITAVLGVRPLSRKLSRDFMIFYSTNSIQFSTALMLRPSQNPI